MSGVALLLLLVLLATSQTDAFQPVTPGTTPPKAPPVPPNVAQTPPPWPQAVPDGLPPFPGSGWVPDEPPPPAVVTRAYQLLSELWKYGSGVHRTEKIDARWITFRAEIVKSGKKGVVAYRLKNAAASAAPTPALPAATYQVPTAPDVSPPWGVPADYRPPLPTTTVRTLKLASPMMRGADVTTLQQKLGIKADGIFGVGTKAATINWQKSHGLAADGIVGPATWKALLTPQANA